MNKFKLFFISAITVTVFAVLFNIIFTIAEPNAYDFMTKNVLIKKLPFDKFKKNTGSENIVLVIIDSKTTEKYRWPWRRDLNSKLLDYFYYYAKPKTIVYDSFLTTLDRDNPASDNKYFNSLKKFNNLIIGFKPNFLPAENNEYAKTFNTQFSNKHSLIVINKLTPAYTLFREITPMPQPFYNSVKNFGSVYIPLGFLNRNLASWGFDEIYRTYEYIIQCNQQFYPSLAMGAYLNQETNKKILLEDKTITINSDNKTRKIPLLNKAYYFKNLIFKMTYQTMTTPLKFYEINENGFSHKKYSAVDIMDSYDALQNSKKPVINPELFKDKVVIIGAYSGGSTGLNDIKSSPILINHPGADIQATAIDNILNNDFLFVVPQWINILITFIGCLLVYTFIRISSLFKSIIGTIVLVMVYLFFAALCFYFNIIVNVATPIILYILTTIVAYSHKFVLENRSKEKVKSAMGKYMSQDVMKRVIQNIDNLGLGGKKSTVTVLFADIRGFTSMSEQMSAQQVSEILNEYFTEIEPIITKYNGVINKFIGDAVMAIFGEPIQDKNHAQNAVKCAYSMLEKVKELQKKWIKEGKPKLEIGVGVNTGEVFVGNIGSINRMEYTVIGDTVNLASRLESYNKIYKTKLLISSTTYEEVKGFTDVIKISDVQIRGKANKMDIYEVLKVLEL